MVNRLRSTIILLLFGILLSSCNSEILRQQQEELQRQQEEIARQKKELEELTLARQKEEQQRQDCNRAFALYEKAQAAKNPAAATSLYRQGLKLCPNDDVAHYELGKILKAGGQTKEAADEFEAAVKINPNFIDARRELDVIRKR